MQAPRKIAVAGATGRAGHHAVDLLEREGYEVVGISRSLGVDVITGDGLAEALVGVDTVIDAATGPSPDEAAATEFFTTAARNLQEAGEQAGVQRMVVVSIIGIDRFSTGYNAAKLAHEQAMRSGPIPARVLRAAQFHEFVPQLVDWSRQGDVVYLPKMRTQPVSARSVARALADLATASAPAPQADGQPILEIAGPQEENLIDLATQLVARRGDAVRIEAGGEWAGGDLAGADGDLYESGALLPGPNATLAGPTFAAWLDAGERDPVDP